MSCRVLDPVGVDPDPDPVLEIKNLIRKSRKPGSGSGMNPVKTGSGS